MSRAPTLVISGMHRSATSLTAAALQAAGLSIGERLMGPFPGNPRGHFEDLDFVEIHREALQSQDLPEHGLIAEGGPLVLPSSCIHHAEAIIAARRASNRPWGFKDPRTVLFLDSWQALLPEAHWLFLFRDPFLVLDSLQRRGDTLAMQTPGDVLRCWMHYNSLILDFVRAHGPRTLLCELDGSENALTLLVEAVTTRLGFPPTRTPSVFEPTLLSTTATTPVPEIRPYVRAEAAELYAQIQATARAQQDKPALLS